MSKQLTHRGTMQAERMAAHALDHLIGLVPERGLFMLNASQSALARAASNVLAATREKRREVQDRNNMRDRERRRRQ